MVWPSVRLALRVSGVVMFGALGAGATSPPQGRAVLEAPRAPTPAPVGATFFDADLAVEAARLAANRGHPEGIAPLLAVAAHYEEVPPGVVERILAATADAAETDPLVAAHAAFLLSRVEDDRGPEGAGDRRRATLGWLNRFWVVGPFGDGRSSFGESFAPEHDLGLPDPARRYPGKEREVSWRSGAEVVRQGALYLDGLLRPDAQTAAYVMSFVHSERAAKAALRLGSSGPTKVWVNGALVEARDLARNAAFDQDAVGVTLRRGWNRILIKTVVIDGPWRLFARLTDPSGRALAFTQADRPSPAPASADAAAWGAAATATRAPVIPVRALD